MRLLRQTVRSALAVLTVFMVMSPIVHASSDAVLSNGVASSLFTPLTAKLTTKRAGHTATLLEDGTVLITGGFRSATFTAPALKSAEIYDPTTNTFTALAAKMRSARVSHAATRLSDGRVLLSGGQTNNDGDGINSAEIFDPLTQTFARVRKSMTSPRGGHTSVLLPDGRVLIVGGYDNSYASLDTAEVFNPAPQRFTALPSKMVTGRSELDATMLANGTVLITGGGSCDDTFDTAELFDPATQGFTALSSTMTALRGAHASSRLADGTVLVSGGGSDGSEPPATLVVLKTAERFDPSTLSFSGIRKRMTTARLFHTQTTMSDGSVLLTGGLNLRADRSLHILNTAEKYLP